VDEFRLSAVALIACWACDALAPNEDVSPLTFDVREVDYFGPPGAGPPIVLFLATETQYPCMNYGLDSKLDVHASTLNVDVSTRVTRPEICLTAIGPACSEPCCRSSRVSTSWSLHAQAKPIATP